MLPTEAGGLVMVVRLRSMPGTKHQRDPQGVHPQGNDPEADHNREHAPSQPKREHGPQTPGMYDGRFGYDTLGMMEGTTMTATTAPPSPPRAAVWQRKRWTIAEFDRLVSEGFVREGGREFLWDGEIVEAMPENPPHANATMNLLTLLFARFPAADWTVNLDKPVALKERYKPQPDVTVLRGPRSTYRTRTPAPADVALLIEVSDTTYSDDAGILLRAYAEVGIPRYWIINIDARRVEVYTDPGRAEDGAGAYLRRQDYGLDARIPLDGIAGGGGMPPEPIPVLEILRDSIEAGPAGGGA